MLIKNIVSLVKEYPPVRAKKKSTSGKKRIVKGWDITEVLRQLLDCSRKLDNKHSGKIFLQEEWSGEVLYHQAITRLLDSRNQADYDY